MAKYSKKAGEKVERAIHEMHEGTLKSGGSGKKVTSKKQAIAIGLSEAREEGAKVPEKKAAAKKSAAKKKAAPKKAAIKKAAAAKKNRRLKKLQQKSRRLRNLQRRKHRPKKPRLRNRHRNVLEQQVRLSYIF